MGLETALSYQVQTGKESMPQGRESQWSADVSEGCSELATGKNILVPETCPARVKQKEPIIITIV
jgi:hypothetical protein